MDVHRRGADCPGNTRRQSRARFLGNKRGSAPTPPYQNPGKNAHDGGMVYARRNGDAAVLKLEATKAEELLKAFSEL